MMLRLFDIDSIFYMSCLSHPPTVLCIRCVSLNIGLSRIFRCVLFHCGLGGQQPNRMTDVILAGLEMEKILVIRY